MLTAIELDWGEQRQGAGWTVQALREEAGQAEGGQRGTGARARGHGLGIQSGMWGQGGRR